MEEAAPLLGRREGEGSETPESVANAARTTVLIYMALHNVALGLFVALRETYTEKVLRASDPVATATFAVVAFYVGHAFSMPILGKLSDAVGRRPLMLMGIGIAGGAFGIVAMTSSPWVFVACFGAVGALDSANTMMTLALVDTSNAPLVSDMNNGCLSRTIRNARLAHLPGFRDDDDDDDDDDGLGSRRGRPKNKLVERRIGVLFSAAWTVGLVGTVIGVGSAPFFASSSVGARGAIGGVAGLYQILLFVVLVYMPETAFFVSAQRRDGDEKDASSSITQTTPGMIGALIIAAVREQRAGAKALLGTARRRTLLLATFLQHVAAAGAFSLIMYWVVFKFGFGVAAQALVALLGLFVVAVAVVALQTIGVQYFANGKSEKACADLVLFAAPFWILLGLATEPWMAFVGALAIAAVAIFPELRALLTADVPLFQRASLVGEDSVETNQGYVQGALTSINAVSDIIGAVGLLVLFESTVDDDVPHDSRRSRRSLRANAIWHAALGLQLLVVALLYVTPPEEEDDDSRAQEGASDSNNNNNNNNKATHHSSSSSSPGEEEEEEDVYSPSPARGSPFFSGGALSSSAKKKRKKKKKHQQSTVVATQQVDIIKV